MGWAMSRFIERTCRTQATLFPDWLDDYISEENPVRIIDVFWVKLAAAYAYLDRKEEATKVIEILKENELKKFSCP